MLMVIGLLLLQGAFGADVNIRKTQLSFHHSFISIDKFPPFYQFG